MCARGQTFVSCGCHFPFSFSHKKGNFSKEMVGFVGASHDINAGVDVPICNVCVYVCKYVCNDTWEAPVLNASKKSSEDKSFKFVKDRCCAVSIGWSVMFIRTLSFIDLHPWRTGASTLCVCPTSQKERPTLSPNSSCVTGVMFKWVKSQDYVPCTMWASCLLKIHVFWRMTQNCLAGSYRRLEELCVSVCRNYLKRGAQRLQRGFWGWSQWAPLTIYQTSRLHIPEDLNLRHRLFANTESWDFINIVNGGRRTQIAQLNDSIDAIIHTFMCPYVSF